MRVSNLFYNYNQKTNNKNMSLGEHTKHLDSKPSFNGALIMTNRQIQAIENQGLFTDLLYKRSVAFKYSNEKGLIASFTKLTDDYIKKNADKILGKNNYQYKIFDTKEVAANSYQQLKEYNNKEIAAYSMCAENFTHSRFAAAYIRKNDELETALKIAGLKPENNAINGVRRLVDSIKEIGIVHKLSFDLTRFQEKLTKSLSKHKTEKNEIIDTEIGSLSIYKRIVRIGEKYYTDNYLNGATFDYKVPITTTIAGNPSLRKTELLDITNEIIFDAPKKAAKKIIKQIDQNIKNMVNAKKMNNS